MRCLVITRRLEGRVNFENMFLFYTIFTTHYPQIIYLIIHICFLPFTKTFLEILNPVSRNATTQVTKTLCFLEWEAIKYHIAHLFPVMSIPISFTWQDSYNFFTDKLEVPWSTFAGNSCSLLYPTSNHFRRSGELILNLGAHVLKPILWKSDSVRLIYVFTHKGNL